jgi:hypothetical protein
VFAFDLYDNDKSGLLSEDEVATMLKDLYGRTYHTNPRAKAIASEIKKLEHLRGEFSLAKFAKFVKTHEEMLFPAFQMQLKIQEKVFGRRFWERCSSRRVEICKGKYASITEIMMMVGI